MQREGFAFSFCFNKIPVQNKVGFHRWRSVKCKVFCDCIYHVLPGTLPFLILFPFAPFQPMDQASLKNSDVLILTGLTQIPTANPDGMVGEFCSNLGRSLREISCLFYLLIHGFGWEIILRFLELSKFSSYSSWHKTTCLDFTTCS